MPTYNNALTDQPANRLAFPSSIGPVPRNEYLGALADFLAKSYSPERTQQMQGISQLLGMPAVSRTLDMMSYGDPLTTGAGGLGGTTRVKPDVLEAALTVAPLGKPATMATLQAARLARQAAMAGGRAGERYAERVVPQIMERGGLGAEMLQGMSQGTRRQIFVGENSKTWNKANANQALEMEKAGAKPEDIWATTGTFRGPEGKLRQEISDLPAVFREDQLPQAPSLLSVATQYLRDKGVITNPNRDIASIGVPEELRKEAIDYAKTKLQQMDQPKTLLGNVFEHPELLQAYPDLAKIKVGKETSGNYRGMFNPEENTITTGGGVIGGPNQARSTMLHELQHAIQETEGMAKGGNPTAMPNIIRKQWSEELEPLQEANSKFRGNLMRLQAASGQQYLNSLDKLSVADNIKPSQVFRFSDWYKYSGDIHDALGKMPTRKSFARDEWLRRASQIMRQKVVEDRPSLLDYKMDEREANNLYRAASRGLDKTRKEAQAFDTIQRKYQELYKMPNEESYMHLAGEAEARATQERLGLNELERLTKFPYESYDRPKNKLLITK